MIKRFCLGYYDKSNEIFDVPLEELIEDLKTGFDLNFRAIRSMNESERQAIRLPLKEYFEKNIIYPDNLSFKIGETLTSIGSNYVLNFYTEGIKPTDKEFESYHEFQNYEWLTKNELIYRFVAEFNIIDKEYIFTHSISE